MKIKRSNQISAFGGMNFVFDFLRNNNFDRIIVESLPSLVRQSQYSWCDIIYSLFSIFLCGGDCIEDVQTHLKSHFQNNPYIKMPSPDTILRRLLQLSVANKTCKTKRGEVIHDFNTNQTLERLNIALLKKMRAFSTNEIILDYDNTIIFNEKSDSKMTYKRNPGYQPGVCTINEEQVLYIENRNGNSDAKAFQSETLGRLFNLLKAHKIKKADHFRADAASYQYDVIKLLEHEVKNFYIGCRNSYVEKYFAQVQKWEKLHDDENDFMEVGEINIIPFTKQTKSPKEYRMIVKRSPREDNQMNLFTGDAYDYRAIITNNHTMTVKQVALFYNHRGNMEKQFDIMKNDFGWNNMPFSKLNENTVFLYMTAICRNLYKKIITTFSKTIKFLKPTFRLKKFLFRFIILPSKWIKHARSNYLKIYGDLRFCT